MWPFPGSPVPGAFMPWTPMIMPWELVVMVMWEAVMFVGALGILAAVAHWRRPFAALEQLETQLAAAGGGRKKGSEDDETRVITALGGWGLNLTGLVQDDTGNELQGLLQVEDLLLGVVIRNPTHLDMMTNTHKGEVLGSPYGTQKDSCC